MSVLQFGQTGCGPYNREHEWGEYAQHEERGVLVITHGRRAGRIYATEQSWRERECGQCHQIDRAFYAGQSSEWPTTVPA